MRKVRKSGRLVSGFGINDADYPVSGSKKDGRDACIFYSKWSKMIYRCYGNDKRLKSYQESTVCDEWKRFSSFRSWMITQDWEGKELDKDLLSDGYIYSPETCLFIDQNVNKFMTDRFLHRGDFKLGVTPSGRKFRARCSDLNGLELHLGSFESEDVAHIVYSKKKRELCEVLASKQTDLRVAKALLNKYREVQ